MISDKIRKLRYASGLTQKELAEQSGLSLRTIQRAENGRTRPGQHTLKSLSEVLGKDLLKADHTKKADAGLYRKMIALPAIVSLPFPWIGILVPVFSWYKGRELDPGIDRLAINVIIFQVIWIGVYIVSEILLMNYMSSQIMEINPSDGFDFINDFNTMSLVINGGLFLINAGYMSYLAFRNPEQDTRTTYYSRIR